MSVNVEYFIWHISYFKKKSIMTHNLYILWIKSLKLFFRGEVTIFLDFMLFLWV